MLQNSTQSGSAALGAAYLVRLSDYVIAVQNGCLITESNISPLTG